MSALRLDRLLELLTSMELVMGMLWLGLALFTVGLAVLLYTRWGQYKPLRKCMAMSLLAHLLLAGYAATVEIVTPIIPQLSEPVVQVTLSDKPDEKPGVGGAALPAAKMSDRPWEVFASDAVAQPKEAVLERGKTDQPAAPRIAWFASRRPNCPVLRRWITSPWPRPNRFRRKLRPWSKRPGEPPRANRPRPSRPRLPNAAMRPRLRCRAPPRRPANA